MVDTSSKPNVELARRFESACDNNPDVPPQNYGRLKWFVDEFERLFGETVTQESVRRWLGGIARPKPTKLAMMARILRVDEAWLSVGTEGALKARRNISHNALAGGATNILAGLIQMAGGNPAFPSSDDSRAVKEGIDLYAIIKGANYAFHVEPSLSENGRTYFSIPTKSQSAVNIGVHVGEDLDIALYEIPWDALKDKGGVKAGHFEFDLVEGGPDIRRITSLADRL